MRETDRPDSPADVVLPDELSADYLTFYRVVPLRMTAKAVHVGAVGQPAQGVVEELEEVFGKSVELEAIDDHTLESGIRHLSARSETVLELVKDLDAATPDTAADSPSPADVRDLANQPPVIRFVNVLIREAAESRASDVHLDATRGGLRVRFRIDGVLSEVPAPPAALQHAVLSRLKLMAELDIAERRLPQDGRLRVRLESRELDLRVATVPSHFGESITLRLLDRGGRPSELADLGMAPDVLERFTRAARKPHGLVLVTGPTGSGKTTTLHAALNLRDRSAEHIISVEDPVEYELPGVTQVHVQEKIGLTFSRILRSLLRHDPDVLMVGEMRDEETTDIALRAAMTGHLVFSTLHTNDALGAISRLTDLKAASYLIATTLEAVLGQRLVRRICGHCGKSYKADPQVVALLAAVPVGTVRLSRGEGCAQCRGTGYHGRCGIFELLALDEDLRSAIARGDGREALREQVAVQTMQTLRQDGWAKVQAGLTTPEEVLRVVQA